MNQIRANDMLAQMRQRQWELQQAQQRDQANANAAEVYGNANPHNQSPADLEVSKAQIRNGTFSIEPTINALAASANLTDRTKAADLFASSHPSWDQAHIAAAHARILSGQSDGSAEESAYANAASDTNAATKTINASNAAATPASQAAAANKQFDTSVQLDAGNTLLNQPPITGPLDSPDTQAQLDKTAILRGQAKIPVTAEMPISSGEAANAATAKLTQESLGAQAKPRAPTEIVPAVAPTNPLTGAPASGGGFAQAGSGPDTKATAASTSAEAQAKNTSEYAAGVLQGGIQEGQGAQKVLNDVNQLRYLASVMNNDGPMNQIQNKLADEMYKRFDLTMTGSESARQVFNNYVAALMGEWRKDVGVQRLALPEIQLGALSLPNANMSLDALNSALDFVQAKAQISDKVGQAALRYWTNKGAPLEDNANAFLGERNKLYAPEANPASTIKKEREEKTQVNSPTGPKHYKIVNGQRVEIPNP